MTSGLLSSNSNSWETPSELFEKLDSIYHFTLDPCATPENATTVSSSEIGLAFEILKTNYKNILSEDELKSEVISWEASNILMDIEL